jgi:hypothetical protein
MLFETIRNIILAVVILCVLLLGRVIIKSKSKNKSLNITVLSVAFIVFFYIAYSILFENIFITFPTIEEACAYRSKDSVEVILEGEQSVMARFIKDRTNTFAVFYKADGGYKLGTSLSFKLIVSKRLKTSTGRPQIEIVQAKGTDDYYIFIYDTTYDTITEGEYIVADNYKSEYHKFSETFDDTGVTLIEYFAHVYNLDENFTLIINSDEYSYSAILD